MTALLASVRDVGEADLVVAAGCDWLDLKEPREGALGAVDLSVVREVIARHATRLPISATIGDCWDAPWLIPPRVRGLTESGVAFVKVGMFARSLRPGFVAALADAVSLARQVIAVCFAEDPPTIAQLDDLVALGLRGVMLDTADKRGGSLAARLPPARIAGFVAAARARGLLTGLAGSLRAVDVPAMLEYQPDYLGFRGALCRAHAREETIDPPAVRALRALITDRAKRSMASSLP